jgi:hypothetical protein
LKRDNSTKKNILCGAGYVDYMLLASSISIALGEELSADDLDILSAFFAILADNLALISSMDGACSDDSSTQTPIPPAPPASPGSRKKVKKRIKKK